MKREDPKKKKIHTRQNNKDKEGGGFIIRNSARENGVGVENIFKVLKEKKCLPEFYT